MSTEQKSDKPLCKVNGTLSGGRAMCGYVVVGLECCGLPKEKGTCEHQVTESVVRYVPLNNGLVVEGKGFKDFVSGCSHG